MDIKINSSKNVQSTRTTYNNSDSSIKFSDELNSLKEDTDKKTTETTKTEKETDKKTSENKTENNDKKENIDKALDDMKDVLEELNQTDEKSSNRLGNSKDNADNLIKGDALINNDFSIKENQDLMAQMGSNMNFSGDGQPFSSFMGNDGHEKQSHQLGSNTQELAEEASILSTMAENIAMANKMNLETEKTIAKEDGIKKIDTKKGMTIENIVNFNSVIMNQADVEVFANLVQNGEIDMNNLAPEAASKSIQVSKTLADLLAKSMENNQPVRIDFDNDISVIIRISRNGKISADFLPSSQVAEAYLKENLPLLKQRFDENNIEYDELNQRNNKEKERDNNRKKGQENER